ncbi:MAG: biotin--[acetyl-CoA-carboxylase] ligase [Candidatus Omnitrophica bacterium]|nr:biotin--[acetyl-CoA-carboxylase] ligase [Candidatus Omnitrophota bacterium]MDD5352947.1 biotin--[acetyl-CoA-carboxylase] ligase [Candidatus Omnitrophota bacterium]MDD5550546.1 biotin--[acetyl-CoA-carboxylase] ligase [Candidatus Omnitrophota bacterium]
MNKKILALLRNATAYVSGEEISRQLDISRSAIWKHVQELRQEGYEIIAVPHLGYELVSIPDQLLPEEISPGLNTKIMGREIYHYDMVPSSMDIAMDLAIKGCKEGVVVFAEGQYKGRGRLSRFWSSPKNKGIYFSLILRPKISPNECPKLTLLSAVAVCQAIRQITGLECFIKWPNDLIIDNKKVGGILTEMNADTDMVRFVVIGIGINVNTSESLLPVKSTSLKEQSGERISRIELAREILKQLEREYILFQKEGFKTIIEKWKKLSATLGHRIRVHFRKEYIEGQALDIDEQGALLLKKDSGHIERITAGDILKVR